MNLYVLFLVLFAIVCIILIVLLPLSVSIHVPSTNNVCIQNNIYKSHKILDAIKKHDMIFISAQPDEPYFHWQVELYLYQFAKHGIADNCYAIFGYKSEPSEYIKNLSKHFKNIRWYKDTRTDMSYIPSIRPNIMKQFFAEYPHIGKNVFYHDSDILLPQLPNFQDMLEDDIGYVSDTVSYIGYEYIVECCNRYEQKHKTPEKDLLYRMTDTVGIDTDVVKQNQVNSGGAQYLLKNIDTSFWQQVEDTCNTLWKMFTEYDNTYPIDHPIQSWCTDMWAVLWIYWKRGGTTRVHNELDFSWAVDSIDAYHRKKIFHLAGVTQDIAFDKFFKGKYNNENVFDAYRKNKSIFDHVSSTNATYPYVQLIKEYVECK